MPDSFVPKCSFLELLPISPNTFFCSLPNDRRRRLVVRLLTGWLSSVARDNSARKSAADWRVDELEHELELELVRREVRFESSSGVLSFVGAG
jgi:hypothetical protein